MSEFNNEDAYEIYQVENSITEAAKKHCEILGIEYEEKYRHRLSRYINTLDDSPREDSEGNVKPTKSSPKYSAFDDDGNFLSPEQVCVKYGLPFNYLQLRISHRHQSKDIK